MADEEQEGVPGDDSDTTREMLRQTFDADALKYDRARPGYPDEVFDRIEAAGALDGSSFDASSLDGASLGVGRAVLEIGSGTGQATRSMAARGWNVTAVELGEELARVGRANAAQYSSLNSPRVGKVRVIAGDIETVERSVVMQADLLAANGFDAVVAFTCFHWLNPSTRAGLVASYLRPGGVASIVDTHHVANPPGDPSESFFVASQAMHAHYMPEARADDWLLAADEVAPRIGSLEHQDLTPLDEHRIVGDIAYSADAYIDLLGTYSGHLALDEADRVNLFAEIRDSINNDYGGKITKRYLYTVSLASKN